MPLGAFASSLSGGFGGGPGIMPMPSSYMHPSSWYSGNSMYGQPQPQGSFQYQNQQQQPPRNQSYSQPGQSQYPSDWSAPPPWSGYGYANKYQDQSNSYWYNGDGAYPSEESFRSESPTRGASTPVSEEPTLLNNPVWDSSSPWTGSSTVQGSFMEYCQEAYRVKSASKAESSRIREKIGQALLVNNHQMVKEYKALAGSFRDITASLPEHVKGDLGLTRFGELLGDLGKSIQSATGLATGLSEKTHKEVDDLESMMELNEMMAQFNGAETKGSDVRTAKGLFGKYGSRVKADQNDEAIQSPFEVYLHSRYQNAPDDESIPFYTTDPQTQIPTPDATATGTGTGTGTGRRTNIFAGANAGNPFAQWSNSFGFGNGFNNYNTGNPFGYGSRYHNSAAQNPTLSELLSSLYNRSQNQNLGSPYGGPGVSFGPGSFANLNRFGAL
ncbi:uncharacterized protein L199_002380 [Kwoniella botswanensis]|uniref:uncharacterized protein n=1 Tax=Kwoniella botswanensis TaxID=1268659 RepID=UPI00315CD126